MSDEHPLLNQNTDLKFRALKKKSLERVERNQSIKNLKRWKMWHSTGSLNYFIPLISFYTPPKNIRKPSYSVFRVYKRPMT